MARRTRPLHVETADACDTGVAEPAALVVFTGMTGLWWLKFLRPGFRHCFVVVFQDDTAIICDPLSNQMLLGAVRPADARLVSDWYRERGFVVVQAVVRTAPRTAAPFRPFTCVEAVKRALGISAPFVLTPWQLYRHLLAAAADAAHEALDTGCRKEYVPFRERAECVPTRSPLQACTENRDSS